MKDRLKKKLKAKKILSQNRPKPILPFAARVTEKEYEMSVEYQQQLAILMQLIEKRDHYAREIPNLPPEARAAAKPAFEELNESIESLEQKLADEYESYQAKRRNDDKISQAINHGLEATEVLYIEIKNKVPHLFEEFKKIVIQDMTPDEEQEFYDRVVVHEAAMKKK